MKVADAVKIENEISLAVDGLNRLIQKAATSGMQCTIDYQSFQHVGGLVFDIVQVECRINPSKLESD